MKYMGCVTDKEFKLALTEQYPDRSPHSNDSQRRRMIFLSRVDLSKLAAKYNARESISGLSGIKKIGMNAMRSLIQLKRLGI